MRTVPIWFLIIYLVPMLATADHYNGTGNPFVVDTDHDGVNDVRELPNDPIDNCIGVFNPQQRDTDGDLIGSACDPDDDGPVLATNNHDRDAYHDLEDLCPGFRDHPYWFTTAAPNYCIAQNIDPDGDEDRDGIRNSDDRYPFFWDPTQTLIGTSYLGFPSSRGPDRDRDFIPNAEDNCPDDWNPNQEGVCTGDWNNNGLPDPVNPRDIQPGEDPDPWNTKNPVSLEELELGEEVARLRARIASVTRERDAATRNLEIARENLANCENRSSVCQSNLEVRARQIDRLLGQINSKTKEIENLQESVDGLASLVDRLRNGTRRLRNKIEQLAELVERLLRRLGRS